MVCDVKVDTEVTKERKLVDKIKARNTKKITDDVMGTLLTLYISDSFPDLFTYFQA